VTNSAAPGTSRRSVLVVTPYFPPAGGGLERYATSISEALHRRHGWRVVFAASGSPRGVKVERRGDSRVYLLPVLFRWSNTPLHPAWPGQLHRIIRAERPDVIYAHTPVPGMAEAVALVSGKVPVVLAYHVGSLGKGNPAFDLAAIVYERAVLGRLTRKASHVIASSSFVQALHARRFGTNSTVIPPGVDVDRFLPAEGAVPARVLFVAGLSRGAAHKGLSELLAAFQLLVRRCPDVELVVVGEGDARADLERAAASEGLGERVRFVGYLDGAELAAAYRSARALALPSQSDNFPLVALEAMASGVAVVATRVGAMAELIGDDERGFLVDPGDVTGLADKLDLLMADPGLAFSLGAAGRALVESTYTWEMQADKTHAVLDRVVAGSRGGRAS
jgi:glycosyltransferase involved in cell wall biosynthesis